MCEEGKCEQWQCGNNFPSKSKIPSPSRTRNGSGASFSQPLVVEDDESNDSPKNNTQHAFPCPARNKPATQVHANPQQHVIPFEGRLAVSQTHVSKSHAAIVEPPSGGQTHEPRYKNPLGYEHVTYFGITSEPKYKLRILQPKKNW